MTPRDRRALTAGALVALSAVLGLRVIPWSLRWRSEVLTRIQRNALHLSRVELDLAGLSELEDSARAVRHQFAGLAPELIAGASQTDARAELVTLVRAIVADSDVAIQRLLPQDDSTRVATLRRVALRAELITDSPGLASLLGRLRRAPAAMEIASLRVLPADPGAGVAEPERLGVTLMLAGWWLPPRDTSRGSS